MKVFSLIFKFSKNNYVSILVAVLFAVVFYIITVIQSGAVSEDELLSSSKGEVLFKWFKKLHLKSDDPRFKITSRIDRIRATKKPPKNEGEQ